MKQLPKVPTGIEGFDGLLSGGIPKGLTILVSGNSGTGKTIFSVQYLYEGITQFKENAVFVACEESSEKIKTLLAGFGWDLEKLEKENKLIFIDAGKRWITDIADESTEFGLGSLLNEIEAAVRKINAKRVVIDPSTSVLMPFKEGVAIRRALRKISTKLESLDCTSIITAERPELEGVTTRFNIENFVLDGVIVLRNVVVGNKLNRVLTIEKMRSVKQDANVHKFDITNKGIVVM